MGSPEPGQGLIGMAMRIRSSLDLPTLRIMIDPTFVSNDVIFEVVRGRGAPSPVARCTLVDLGLPDRLAGRRIDDSRLRVPDHVMAVLQAAVSTLGPSPMEPHAALWLEFPSPRGFLYVVPWERLLQSLDRCVLRLPNHVLRPQAPALTLEVAICSSSPSAKTPFPPPDIMIRLAEQYLEHVGHDVTIHLFTDSVWQAELQERVAARGPTSDRFVVHDPAGAAAYQAPRRTTRLRGSPEVSNPWLRWILDSMAGRRLDVVHFVTHGFLSGERGALAVSGSPTGDDDPVAARFIGSVELTGFLTQLGAWGLIVTGPPQNYSEAGLRELVDAVALVLPGIALTHDLEYDPTCDQFGRALATVFGEDVDVQESLAATTVWVHPRFVEFPDEDQFDLHLDAVGRSVFISEATREALASPDTGAWVASASRSLEQLQVRWLPDSSEESADPAAVAALRNVAELLDRHVSSAYPDSGTARSQA